MIDDIVRRLLFTGLLVSIFSLGFTSAYFLMLLDNSETPFSFSSNDSPSSPNNYLGEDDIKIYDDRVVIYVDDAKLSRYAATGSMQPTLDENSNGIKITPISEDDINVGDIITYRSGPDLIIHRVIEKDKDEQGTYFITKGDNNAFSDGKVRFSDIDSKTIALLY